MPAELQRRAERLLAGDDGWQVPPARDAATVILLRDSSRGIEVLLQRRPGSMAFAAGMHVFPGGRVEEADADPAIPWQGPRDFEPFPLPPAAAATARFRSLTVAGVRETWEEAGVALVVGGGDRLPAGEADFLGWVVAQGQPIAGDALAPWVHWVTPEVESRRFDTRFLISELPEGAHAVDFGVETDRSVWTTPGEALDRLRSGDMPMLPPTADALIQLAGFDSPGAAVADARGRRPRPYLPTPQRSRTGAVSWRIADAYTREVIEG